MFRNHFVWIVLLLFFSVICCFSLTVDTTRLQNEYPHWDLSNPDSTIKLAAIDNYISKNAGRDYLAAFDWDGTLFGEHIPVKEIENVNYAGQPAFYIWGAFNSDKFTEFKLFPMFYTKGSGFEKDVIKVTNSQESKLFDGMKNSDIPPVMPVKPFQSYNPDSYSKFTHTAIFSSGMTPAQLKEAQLEFCKEYNPCKYAFYPMLDVLQKMCDSGYNVWIITGSSPYFVGNALDYLQKNAVYKNNEKYDFSKILINQDGNYDPNISHIAGNGLKLKEDGTFSVVYDDRFIKNEFIDAAGLLYIIDKQGKYVAIKNIEATGTKCAFVAGNTDGDLYGSSYALEGSSLAPDTFVICVNPLKTSKIYQYLQGFKNNSVILDINEVLNNKQGDKNESKQH